MCILVLMLPVRYSHTDTTDTTNSGRSSDVADFLKPQQDTVLLSKYRQVQVMTGVVGGGACPHTWSVTKEEGDVCLQQLRQAVLVVASCLSSFQP